MRRRGTAGALATWLAPLWLASCAVRQTVVLMPDPDGHLGEVEVTTSGGSQRLTKAGEMTSVSGASAPPSAATTADPAWIAETFAEARSAEPAPPDRFLLYFHTGTTDLYERSRSAIPAIAAAIRRRGAVAVLIRGHADATGPDRLNDALSQARAERVRALLRRQGVSPNLISVTSHGKRNPAVPTADGVAEWRNRRVEATVQ